MAGIFEKWTVLPHGKLTQVGENLLTVVGELPMPAGDFPRRMTVVRLSDGRLVVFSAIALDEPEMKALEAWGTPSYLIVPNERHRKDAKIWKDRYPGLVVIAPAGARDKAAEVVPVDDVRASFHDPGVRFVTVPGTNDQEAALVVSNGTETTLVVNELIWNVADRPGFGGWLFRLAGFTGEEPKIPTFVALKSIKDKAALREQLEAWARLSGLTQIIVSHGDIITKDPAGVLRELAASLTEADGDGPMFEGAVDGPPLSS
ncbi:MAG: hypothetical protein JWM82_2195 [Myxococcales bacterium]|nr:hypothetical protein [Myxococcales bacterium]